MSPYCHNPPLGTEAERQNSLSNLLCCSTVRFGNKNRLQKCRKIRPTRRWRTSNRFFAYFGTSAVYQMIQTRIAAGYPLVLAERAFHL
jgi:hypothetical protein